MFEAVADSIGDDRGRLDFGIAEIEHPEHDLLRRKILEHAEIEFGLRRLDRNLLGNGVVEFGEKGITRRLGRTRHDGGVAEAQMHHGRHGDALQRAVDGLHRVAFCQFRIVAHPGLVELDHVGAGLLQVQRLGIDGFGERHRQFFVVLVEFVLGLLAHRERAGQRDLGGAIGVAAKEFHVAQFDRAAAPDLSDHARHRRLLPVSGGDDRGIVGIDAVERGGKTVGIALAADFAVGHDIDAGAFHVADRDDGGVVLRFLQMFGRKPPHFMHAGARHRFGQHRAVHQPFGLRIASDHRRRQQMFWQVHDVLLVVLLLTSLAAARRARFRQRRFRRRAFRSARSRPCARST